MAQDAIIHDCKAASVLVVNNTSQVYLSGHVILWTDALNLV